MGYIPRTIVEPEDIDPKYAMWDAENIIVLSWLLNSMLPEICKGLELLLTTKEIWDSMNQSHSKIGVAT